MSMVNLPSSIFLGLRENTRMKNTDKEREVFVQAIKSRMKELGYNQRSLAVAAGLHVDAVRNLLRGKSKNWRSDTYNAIMQVLWADKQIVQPAPNKQIDFTETEVGLMSAIRGVIVILSNYDVIRQNDIKNVFSYQQKDFRMRAQPGAAAVMRQLIEFLNDSSPEEIIQKAHKPSRHDQDQ